jgi:tetratricopeptide (TPR) repeat protein
VGEDGKGGWSDQGPTADLREFPMGSQNFGGVPYVVGQEPNCCIVLRSNQRPFPERVPAEVTIPLGFPVEGLSFLHSATYCGAGSPAAAYQIQYADGTSQEIALVEGENIRDWTAPPAEFPRERGTRSGVAWTGTTKLFPVVSVFQMLWVNPKPDVAVKAVRFSNPQKSACPILISLTAALKPGKVDLEAIAAAQAKARQWLQAGIAAAAAGKDAEARQAFGQAIREDPKLDAAHQRLCELCERLADEEATLTAYRAWAATSPQTPLPYNKVGEILERRHDDKGALEAYGKSLNVEWNQPPIIEAKSRLMLRVKN